MAGWEEHLRRWEQAGVVDVATAERVRAFEAQRETPAEHRWQVGVMLALGVILLVGGLMLFVAAHWDRVSPWQQLSLVVGFLAIFHALAAMSAKRFPGMAMALHGVGTAGAGAAILTVGEIFNMQEHWPTAVLLWALCAGGRMVAAARPGAADADNAAGAGVDRVRVEFSRGGIRVYVGVQGPDDCRDRGHHADGADSMAAAGSVLGAVRGGRDRAGGVGCDVIGWLGRLDARADGSGGVARGLRGDRYRGGRVWVAVGEAELVACDGGRGDELFAAVEAGVPSAGRRDLWRCALRSQ